MSQNFSSEIIFGHLLYTFGDFFQVTLYSSDVQIRINGVEQNKVSKQNNKEH